MSGQFVFMAVVLSVPGNNLLFFAFPLSDPCKLHPFFGQFRLFLYSCTVVAGNVGTTGRNKQLTTKKDNDMLHHKDLIDKILSACQDIYDTLGYGFFDVLF